MTGSARLTRAARGQLARHVVVLALLAGLGLMVGLQCTSGMAMPHSETTAACASLPTMSNAAEPAASTMCAMPAAEDTSSGWGDSGGVLATCLVFLIAVVTAVAALRPGRLGSVGQLLRPPLVPVTRAVQRRSPTLAELCLLRT